MARILILIGAHLWTSPRSQKEAEALAVAGHEVTVAGIWFDPSGAARDVKLASGRRWRFQPVLDMRSTSTLGRLRNLAVRARRRVDHGLYSRWRVRSPAALGYGAQQLVRAAMGFGADLTIVHSQAGLWVGKTLLERGRRVGVDFEDWFSRDVRKDEVHVESMGWLSELEAQLARNCVYSITTSKALANAMAEAYNAPPPAVVYNVFPMSDLNSLDRAHHDRKNLDIPSVHWFSQTIGRDRGLEILFRALAHVSIPFEIHLRGNPAPGYKAALEQICPPGWRERLFIHETIPNDELLSRISEHDVGLALETPEIASRNLTVTNKLFQYLQGGLAVIATDTCGQREVLSHAPRAGLLIPHNDATALARALTELLSDRERLEAARRASLQAFRERFCWELQSETVVRAAKHALAA